MGSSASGRRLTGRRGRCCRRPCCCGTGAGIPGHGVCMDGVHGRLSGTDIVWEKRWFACSEDSYTEPDISSETQRFCVSAMSNTKAVHRSVEKMSLLLEEEVSRSIGRHQGRDERWRMETVPERSEKQRKFPLPPHPEHTIR